ncbi:MAG: hypothetical protein ACK5RS_01770, partial [Acidobacteriota bacterium]
LAVFPAMPCVVDHRQIYFLVQALQPLQARVSGPRELTRRAVLAPSDFGLSIHQSIIQRAEVEMESASLPRL